MELKTVLFLDNTYKIPYQVSSLTDQVLGGTEASIINTALILSKYFKVVVAQKYRNKELVESTTLRFIPKKEMEKLDVDYIILLRKYPLLKIIKELYPKAKLFLWIHTYKNFEYAFKRVGLSKMKTTIVCNSNTHKLHTETLLNHTWLGKIFSLITKKTKVEYCYNPISNTLLNDAKRDINKLLYFSSPNKGLDQVIIMFKKLQESLPDIKLYVANPGYKKNGIENSGDNIIVLGSLPHHEMMEHVKNSLCIFYPQDTFAETFGLIYAEANSYGTPVLSHDIGSAREILHSNNELVDVKNASKVLFLIKSWQKTYPNITYDNKFSDDSIFQQWKNLFDS